MQIKSFFLLFLFIPLIFCSTGTTKDYPKTSIRNGVLDVDIYLPDAEKGYYRGTRFEWSGLVQEVRYKGHRFFGDWKPAHDPTNHDDVNGIASEFSMGLFGVDPPLGYPEAKPGDPFLKIGVGLLEKGDEEAYSPFINYDIQKAFEWDIQQGTDWIEFKQEIQPFQGWAYRYSKKITLHENQPVMVVSHTMVNTGTKDISTSQYCHNFILIDREPVGPHYLLAFPYDITAKRSFGAYANLNNNRIFITKELSDKALFSEIASRRFSANKHWFVVNNTLTDAYVRVDVDYPLDIFNLYAARYAICPEPFIDIQLQPNETKQWSNTYEFSAERELKEEPMEWPLDIVIENGFSTPKMPLNDFLSQIYFKTGVKFIIEKDVSGHVQAEVNGKNTIGKILWTAFKDKNLHFKKQHNGVIRIYEIAEEEK